MQGLAHASSVDEWVLRNGAPRTPSGPEGSSGKWIVSCAAGQPVLSQLHGCAWVIPIDNRCTALNKARGILIV